MKRKTRWALLAMAATAGVASAADYDWTTGTGDWLDTGWTTNGVAVTPVWDSAANANISGGTMNLTPSSRPTDKIHNVVMAPSSGSATLNITGDLHGQNFEFSGAGGTATINQTAGTVNMDGWMYLGSDGSAANTYNLNGGTWNTTGRKFYLGAYNSANMAVNVNGGHLTSTYSGSSSILYLGGYDNVEGNLNLNSGSVEVSLDEMSIGHANSAQGTLTQTGGYFKFDGSSRLYLGRWDNAIGTLNISGGTNEIDAGASSGIRLGYASGARGVVNLSGGLLDYNATYFIVGQDGTGEVNQTGGRFELPVLVLANNVGGTGVFTISGGSIDATGYIQIKHAGSAFVVDGSGADSIDTGWLLGQDGTLQINLDENGSTLINVGDDGVVLTNMTLSIDTLAGFDGQVGDTYDLIWTASANGIDTNDLAFVNDSATDFDLGIVSKNGGEALQLTVIPEPATLGMVAFLGVAMLWIRRKFRI